MDDENLTLRALRAYYRSNGPYADIPSRWSGVERAANGRHYVVLRGGRSTEGICAMYSLRKSGELRRITRWPQSLVE